MIQEILISVFVAASIVLFYFMTKKKKVQRVSSESPIERAKEVAQKIKQEVMNAIPPEIMASLQKNNNVPPQRFLKPTEFDMHTFSTPQPAAASLCNDKVLYPINGLGVEYGSKFPDDCPMLQFVQPP